MRPRRAARARTRTLPHPFGAEASSPPRSLAPISFASSRYVCPHVPAEHGKGRTTSGSAAKHPPIRAAATTSFTAEQDELASSWKRVSRQAARKRRALQKSERSLRKATTKQREVAGRLRSAEVSEASQAERIKVLKKGRRPMTFREEVLSWMNCNPDVHPLASELEAATFPNRTDESDGCAAPPPPPQCEAGSARGFLPHPSLAQSIGSRRTRPSRTRICARAAAHTPPTDLGTSLGSTRACRGRMRC